MGGRNLKVEPNHVKTCDLCKQTSGIDGTDIVLFGEWMTRSDVEVHYYCLLLSTNLPQRGEDHNGILGFLLRDIRKEIKSAKQRSCSYCGNNGASIRCRGCSDYFHLVCGHTNRCLFQFVGEFKSYCNNCLPLDEEQKKWSVNPPDPFDNKCYICLNSMGAYYPYSWIRAKCCNNGFVHNVCMQKYALTSGYYLKCIWCKDAKFREDVKYLGVFVPDRDAIWERENAFQDLHRSHKRCDMEKCHCADGREYNKGAKWKIIICKLCGLTGAHNPTCIPGMENNRQRLLEFKCDTCSILEHTNMENGNESQCNASVVGVDINATLYVNKEINNNSTKCPKVDTPDFSDNSMSSVDTVINKALLKYSTSSIKLPSAPDKPGQVGIELVTQSVNEEDVKMKECHTGCVIASSVVKDVQELTQCNEPVFGAGPLHIEHPSEIPISIAKDAPELTQCNEPVFGAGPLHIEHPSEIPISIAKDTPELTQCNEPVFGAGPLHIEHPCEIPSTIAKDAQELTKSNEPVCGDGPLHIEHPSEIPSTIAKDAQELTKCNEPVCGDGPLHIEHPSEIPMSIDKDAQELTKCNEPVCGDGPLHIEHPSEIPMSIDKDAQELTKSNEPVCGDSPLHIEHPCEIPSTIAKDAQELSKCNEPVCGDGPLHIEHPSEIPMSIDKDAQELTKSNEPVFGAGPLHIEHPCEIPSTIAKDAQELTKCNEPVCGAGPLHIEHPSDIPISIAKDAPELTQCNEPVVGTVPLHIEHPCEIPSTIAKDTQELTKSNEPVCGDGPLHIEHPSEIPSTIAKDAQELTKCNEPVCGAGPLHIEHPCEIPISIAKDAPELTQCNEPVFGAGPLHIEHLCEIPSTIAKDAQELSKCNEPVCGDGPLHIEHPSEIPMNIDKDAQELTKSNEPVVGTVPLHIEHPCEIPSPSVSKDQTPYNNSQVMDPKQNLSNIELINDQTAADGATIARHSQTGVDGDDLDEINMVADYWWNLIDASYE